MSNARNLANLLNSSGVLTADAGLKADNITIDGTEIDLSSGDLTVDSAGDIILSSGGGEVRFDDGSQQEFVVDMNDASTKTVLRTLVSDSDLVFEGNDGGVGFVAMHIDMSEGGNVGIGTTSPTDTGSFGKALDISSSTGAAVYVRDSGGSKTGHFGQFNEQTSIVSRQDDGNIAFYTGASPSEKMRIHSGGVVSFNNGIELGSALDATAANILDDYEEGTFTASFNGSTGNPTVSYSAQLGTYVKIGKLVYVNVSVIAVGTPSGGSGNLRISGLPFTSKSGVQQAGTVAFTNTLTTTSGTTQMSCNIEGNDSVIHINEHEYSGDSSMSRVQVSGIHNFGPRIVCSITYETS